MPFETQQEEQMALKKANEQLQAELNIDRMKVSEACKRCVCVPDKRTEKQREKLRERSKGRKRGGREEEERRKRGGREKVGERGRLVHTPTHTHSHTHPHSHATRVTPVIALLSSSASFLMG